MLHVLTHRLRLILVVCCVVFVILAFSLCLASGGSQSWAYMYPVIVDQSGNTVTGKKSTKDACDGTPVSDFYAYYGSFRYDRSFCNRDQYEYAAPPDCPMAVDTINCVKADTKDIVSNLKDSWKTYSPGSGWDDFLADVGMLQSNLQAAFPLLFISALGLLVMGAVVVLMLLQPYRFVNKRPLYVYMGFILPFVLILLLEILVVGTVNGSLLNRKYNDVFRSGQVSISYDMTGIMQPGPAASMCGAAISFTILAALCAIGLVWKVFSDAGSDYSETTDEKPAAQPAAPPSNSYQSVP